MIAHRSRPLGARAALLLLAACGCTSLDRFDTKGTAAYCGSLIARPPFSEGLLPVAHPPSLNLRLTLDIDALTSRGSVPVIVGQVLSDDAGDGLCADQPLFPSTSLRTLPALDHDALSSLEFGSGRDYNFFAWVDSSCQGTMLSVVSLMRNGDVEMRVFKPAALAAPDADPSVSPGFGLFMLHRQESGCSF